MSTTTHESSRALGERIRNLRDLRGWSQADLAFHSGLDHAYVRDIEDGTHDPTLNTLRMITRCLGVTISGLLAVAKRDDGDNHRDRDPDGFVT